MAHVGFILSKSPLQYQNEETMYNLAKAAIDDGHQVSIFLFLDGVYGAVKHQAHPEITILPKDRLAELVNKNANILICGTCTNVRGLENGKEFIDGIKIGGLADFALMLGEVDRLVSL